MRRGAGCGAPASQQQRPSPVLRPPAVAGAGFGRSPTHPGNGPLVVSIESAVVQQLPSVPGSFCRHQTRRHRVDARRYGLGTGNGNPVAISSKVHQSPQSPQQVRERREGLLWRLGRINRAVPAFSTCPKQEVLEHEMALADRSGDRGTTTLCLRWGWREHSHDTNWAVDGGFPSASDFRDFCQQRPATQSRGETARLPDAGACLPAQLAIEEDSGFAPRSVRTSIKEQPQTSTSTGKQDGRRGPA